MGAPPKLVGALVGAPPKLVGALVGTSPKISGYFTTIGLRLALVLGWTSAGLVTSTLYSFDYYYLQLLFLLLFPFIFTKFFTMATTS